MGVIKSLKKIRNALKLIEDFSIVDPSDLPAILMGKDFPVKPIHSGWGYRQRGIEYDSYKTFEDCYFCPRCHGIAWRESPRHMRCVYCGQLLDWDGVLKNCGQAVDPGE